VSVSNKVTLNGKRHDVVPTSADLRSTLNQAGYKCAVDWGPGQRRQGCCSTSNPVLPKQVAPRGGVSLQEGAKGVASWVRTGRVIRSDHSHTYMTHFA